MENENYLRREIPPPPKYFMDSVGERIRVLNWEYLRELEEQNKRYQ